MQGSLYNHPRLVTLIAIIIIFAGFNSFNTMPRLEDPHMQSRLVQLTTFYPGADAARVEAEITDKLERKIREVAEVKKVRSVSRSGSSFITIELEDYITNAKPITARIRDKVSEVTDLPEGASAPDFSDTRIYAHSAIIGLTWRSDSPINYGILGRHASELESRLRNLTGTDFVDILGLPEEQIKIILDDAKLASHGLTVEDVAARVRGSDARGSAGMVDSRNSRLVIQVEGALDSLARIRRIPLRADQEGASLRLGDVAKVSRGYEDPPTRLAYIDGHFGVVVAARMLEDNRIDSWSMAVGEVIAGFEATLPASIHINRFFDQRVYADQRLGDLMANLAVGGLVVLVVLFISLGYRASFVAASILPMTLLAALAIVDILGYRIEQVLVTGLIVALGIMVDNAIVMTDEIQQLRLEGERRSIAVARTIKKLWAPLAGSTITTIIAFMPLVLMPGGAGDFMIGVPVAVIASLIGSYVIAFTIISAVAGKVVEGKTADSTGVNTSKKRVWWRDGIEGRLIADLFRKSLQASMRRPLLTMAVASGLPFLGLYLSGSLTEQFFPMSDRNQFRIQLFMPKQSSIEETRAAALRMDAALRQKEKITATQWFIGSRPAKFYYNMFSSNDKVPSIATVAVTTTHFRDIPPLIPRLQDELSALIPEAQVIVRELGTGPPIQAPVEVRVVGPDLSTLFDLGEQLRARLALMPNVTQTKTTLSAGQPLINVVAREDDVSVTGLTLSDIERQLQSLTAGVTPTFIIEETQRVPVQIIVDRDRRSTLSNVADLNLLGTNIRRASDNSFEDVPLSAVADIELTSKVGVINRLNSERINTVQAFLSFGVLPAQTLTAMKASLADTPIAMPPGYRLEIGGESEKRNEALGKLFGTVGVLATLMVLTIVLTFNSFRLAIVTFTAAIQAAGLGILCLWVFDYPMSFVVIIGLLGLIGLAINAAIVILAELRGLDAARAGQTDAVIHGVMKTGRHIVSTTLTTVGGFMPLILAGGAFWPPFAVAIAGGALLSMIVSFYFAPAAFLFLTRITPISDPKGPMTALREMQERGQTLPGE